MVVSAPAPDDEPAEGATGEDALADTVNHYRMYLQAGSGKIGAANHAALWLTGAKRSLLSPQQVGTVDQLVDEARRSLQVDSSAQELTPIESMEKQRRLLSVIAQELEGQREDARRGEEDALVHQQRALRIAAWSLGVATLALIPPIMEIVLKLLGVEL
ncbi:hypothetical protein [Nocardiopsis eucommiae]|uniref:hypothetical protein n=1 Tax=Nocardiopsis eucommiae TaxID=2831970 RepID=UPI003D711F3A